MKHNDKQFQYSQADLKKIDYIQFGLLSPEEIKNMAVCEITNPITFDNKGNPNDNGINNLKMGSSESKFECKTCKCNSKECPGHFGYIKLAKPVYHVFFIDICLKVLQCVCYKCSTLIINDKKKDLIRRISNPKTRLSKIYELSKPNSSKLKNLKNCPKPECKEIQPKYKKENLKIIKEISEEEQNQKEISSDIISPKEVLDIFRKISDEDIILLGFNPKYSRPEWMIIQNLAVCPPQVRPSVSVDLSLRAQDDLTHQYNQILKSNFILQKEEERCNENNMTILQDKFDNLQMNVAALMRNDLSSGIAKKKSGEPIKSFFARLKGKEGRIRGNLMGKRVDFSARSVISPDPNLEVDELGVPLSIAMDLTYPEVVTDYNKEKLRELIKNGPYKYPGAVMVRFFNGGIKNLNYCKKRDELPLNKDDIVERHIQNGDYVIFNRQPSLHKMSMMGHRVHILPYSTFRLNLSVTTPYNADFDGDEMNLHLPQTFESISEIMNIMHVPRQIVSPQSNQPVIGIVQDTLIGCKLFTSRDTFITYEQVMDLVMWIKDFKIENLPVPCIMKPKLLWSGKQIFSLILPKQLNLIKIREDPPKNVDYKLNSIDNYVEIKRGELLQGIICKKTVGTSGGGIVHNIWTEVGPMETMEFLGNCQKLINNYLLITGWTVGISDIICDADTREKIDEALDNMKEGFSEILTNAQKGSLLTQPGKNMIDSFERNVNTELNKARDKVGLLVQESISYKNHLKNMVSAGSKGNPTNISQIIAFLGQQNLEGKRIPFGFYKRTLPHFLKDDYKWESKGFVENSFLKGLNPQEFFFHGMTGREGIIDKAVKTAQTGYIQRRLIKCLEDIIASYDGTVRNSLGHIIQFSYGEDGMAGEYIQTQKFKTLKMDNATLERNYKFVENDEDEFHFFNRVDRFMENSVIQELRGINFNFLKISLNNEYEQIKKDRDDMRKIVLDEDTINIPVNISAIITITKNENGINEFNKSDLNPLYVLEKIEELKKELVKIKSIGKKNINENQNEEEKASLTLFNRVLNYSLSTKNIIFKHRLSKIAFDFVWNEIKSKFQQSIVNPGEMVGSIASQSIGEPSTQMTLDTFHLAGVSFANVTLGVPRLMEILNLSKNIKNPSMTIYFKKKDGCYNSQKIFELNNAIQYTSLLDILSLYEIYYDPDITSTIIEEDQNMVNNYMKIMGEKIETIKDNISPWVLRLKLDKDYININMGKFEEKIKACIKLGKVLIIYSHAVDKKKIHIRLYSDDKDEITEEEKERLKSLEYLNIFGNDILKVPLSGINSIKKVYYKNINKIKYDEITGELIKKKEESNDPKNNSEKKEEIKEEDDPLKETVFETEGTNLAEIFGINEVDFKRTITNDIHDVYKVLGVEAARKTIIQEIRNVLKAYGIYINYRHISILCDYMTQKGTLISISIHGLKKTGYGPLRKSTFEESAQILMEAGVFSEKDEIKGVSEHILLGKLARVGTGIVDLLLDTKFYEKEKKNEYSNEYSSNEYQSTPFNCNSPIHSLPENNNNFSTYENNRVNFSSPYDPGNLREGPSSFISTPYPNNYNISPTNSARNENNPQTPYSYSQNLRVPYSSYSPTTPAINNYLSSFKESNSPNQSFNMSHYAPGSPNYLNQNENLNVNNISSPFIKNDKNEDNEEEEEEEDENKKD